MLNVGKRSFLFSKKSSAVETFYIGGSFQGTHGGEHLSFWDGSKWNPLGEPNNTVLNTQFDSNGNLYITGTFTAVGGVAANYIAKWDGSSWSSLGTGLGAAGFSIAIDSNDNVYVGGSFTTAGGNTANRVAKWNGSAWSALGDGTNNLVYSLAIDSSDNLYAGGFFTTAGGVSANRIAKWNTSSWSGLGSGMNGYVYSIIIDSSDNLYATGSFTTSGGVTTNAIAKWDVTSETWSGFSSGVGNSTNSGQSLMFLNGELVVGGFFTLPTPARLVKWNGTSWEASFGFPNNATYGLTPISSTSNSFYANGAFSNLGNTDGDRVAYWNGSSWENMGRGHSSSIPSRRGVVKDGIFYLGGPAFFNNKNYERFLSVSDDVLGETTSFNGNIYAFARDSSGNLYVGGSFTTINGSGANRIAKWNGTNWEEFGGGMDNLVRSIVIDSNGVLYAGGGFTTANGVSANYIAKWNGTNWEAFGIGFDANVRCLALDSDDNLYAGGAFTIADNSGNSISVNRIAKWNVTSNTWSAFGSGMPSGSTVYSIAFDSNGVLHAGGYFTTANSVPVNGVAKWNGTNWEAFGSGVGNNSVFSIAFDSEDFLHAAGWFPSANGVTVNYIAKWNGTDWEAFGTGMNTRVNTITFGPDGTLYAGGDFVTAGGNPAFRTAKWNGSSWEKFVDVDNRVSTILITNS